MTSTESDNLPRKVLQEIVANQSNNVRCENLDDEKVILGERRTVLAKNSLTKVKKGAVLFESKKVKAKLNDKRSHYNHDTKAVARMEAEVLVLDKGSGAAVAAAITLDMEEKSMTLNCFGEDRGALLMKIFLEPFLVQLEGEEARGEPRSGNLEENWRVAAGGRNSDSWRWRSGGVVEQRRRPEVTPTCSHPKARGEVGEGRVMEHRMAKLALAEIGKQKLMDADGSENGRRAKKVESEEKVRLRAERARKREEEEAKKKKEDEARRREAEVKQLEREKESEIEVEKKERMEKLWQELLALPSEDGVGLMRKRELEEEEEGWASEDMGRELLNILANIAIKEGEELTNKEEEAVKGGKRRVSFDDQDVEIGNFEDRDEKVALSDSNNEKNLPGILKCQKTTASKNDVEKEIVRRWQNLDFSISLNADVTILSLLTRDNFQAPGVAPGALPIPRTSTACDIHHSSDPYISTIVTPCFSQILLLRRFATRLIFHVDFWLDGSSHFMSMTLSKKRLLFEFLPFHTSFQFYNDGEDRNDYNVANDGDDNALLVKVVNRVLKCTKSGQK